MQRYCIFVEYARLTGAFLVLCQYTFTFFLPFTLSLLVIRRDVAPARPPEKAAGLSCVLYVYAVQLFRPLKREEEI